MGFFARIISSAFLILPWICGCTAHYCYFCNTDILNAENISPAVRSELNRQRVFTYSHQVAKLTCRPPHLMQSASGQLCSTPLCVTIRLNKSGDKSEFIVLGCAETILRPTIFDRIPKQAYQMEGNQSVCMNIDHPGGSGLRFTVCFCNLHWCNTGEEDKPKTAVPKTTAATPSTVTATSSSTGTTTPSTVPTISSSTGTTKKTYFSPFPQAPAADLEQKFHAYHKKYYWTPRPTTINPVARYPTFVIPAVTTQGRVPDKDELKTKLLEKEQKKKEYESSTVHGSTAANPMTTGEIRPATSPTDEAEVLDVFNTHGAPSNESTLRPFENDAFNISTNASDLLLEMSTLVYDESRLQQSKQASSGTKLHVDYYFIILIIGGALCRSIL